MLPYALVCGESLVDVVRRREADGTLGEPTVHPGGSPANVAVALCRLHRLTALATCFAADDHGAVIARHLAREGVRLAGDPAVVERTSVAQATIGTDGSASYTFDLDWRLGPVEHPDDLALGLVHVSSYSAVLGEAGLAVADLVEGSAAEALISYDVNLREAVTGAGEEIRARVERLVAAADVVKASDEDLRGLWPDAAPEETARRLRGLGPAVLVLTRGGDGATVFAADGEAEVPAAEVPGTHGVVDTIAAGDTFAAGVIDGLWSRGLIGAAHRPALRALPVAGWAVIAAHAAAAAAIAVSRAGAQPPYRAELDAASPLRETTTSS